MGLVEVQKKSLIKFIPPFFFFLFMQNQCLCAEMLRSGRDATGRGRLPLLMKRTYYNLSAGWVGGWMLL